MTELEQEAHSARMRTRLAIRRERWLREERSRHEMAIFVVWTCFTIMAVAAAMMAQ